MGLGRVRIKKEFLQTISYKILGTNSFSYKICETTGPRVEGSTYGKMIKKMKNCLNWFGVHTLEIFPVTAVLFQVKISRSKTWATPAEERQFI